VRKPIVVSVQSLRLSFGQRTVAFLVNLAQRVQVFSQKLWESWSFRWILVCWNCGPKGTKSLSCFSLLPSIKLISTLCGTI